MVNEGGIVFGYSRSCSMKLYSFLGAIVVDKRFKNDIIQNIFQSGKCVIFGARNIDDLCKFISLLKNPLTLT